MPKKLKRHSAPYSDLERAYIKRFAKDGLSARETAKRLGRTLGGLKFYAMKHKISFRAIRQVSRQKALAKKRAKYGMYARLSYGARR